MLLKMEPSPSGNQKQVQKSSTDSTKTKVADDKNVAAPPEKSMVAHSDVQDQRPADRYQPRNAVMLSCTRIALVLRDMKGLFLINSQLT